jgi:SAM-dependent methyltransferase
MKNLEITKCRLCNHGTFTKILNFGYISLGNDLQDNFKNSLKTKKYLLCLIRCKSCSHFQLNNSVNPRVLYAKNYTYLSNTGLSFVKYLKENSKKLIKKLNLRKKNIVLDIGSNDGTALSFYKQSGMKVCGVDPASKPAKIANKKKIFTYNDFFSKKIVHKIFTKFGKADLIISHNTLAHVENIHEIFENIYLALKKDGYFSFEIGYFKNVIENNYFDTIYHEHLDYHHANPLASFLIKIGFSIIDIQTNKIQGGSLKILCKKDNKKKIYKKVKKFLTREKKTILYKSTYLKLWKKKIDEKMKKLEKLIKKKHKEKKIILGYGAPTKCVLLLNQSKINNNEIKNVVEDNSLKVSKFLPESGIKISSIQTLNAIKPDYLVIFAWNFAKDIINKLKKMKIKTKVIIPLPKLKIIKL